MAALEHFDVMIVGAGLSGIGAAYHLQKRCPGKSYVILEQREAIGGTWDLFRYPGIRSDSDMYTLGYNFKPWKEAQAIADGPSILKYVRETASENGIDPHIRFQHKVKAASWSTEDARWTVEAEHGGRTVRFTCGFLFMCSGYYDYDAGYTPDFKDIGKFKGQVIHPQHWPENLDYAGKKVVVIGSGATAVTLVPEMAKTAGHVTMLQRSPTYMVTRPGQDAAALWLRKKLPEMAAYQLTRWKNVLLGMYFFRLARRKPEQTKGRLIGLVRKELGEDYDVETHFTPRYNPWDQRICLVPDSDFFLALKNGTSSIVTDTIQGFTAKGIKLTSGQELEADIIVTATGLSLNVLGGMAVSVDGKAIDFGKTLTFKGMMYRDVPNLASSFGYTNASWTLKADLTCEYVCRLLNKLDRSGMRQATPRLTDPSVKEVPWLDFSSGYVQRAIAHLPKQGDKAPWKLHQNYALDILNLRYSSMDNAALEYSNPKRAAKAQQSRPASSQAA